MHRIKEGDQLVKDIIFLRDEEGEGEPILKPVMRNGERQGSHTPLSAVRKRFLKEVTALDAKYKVLVNPQLFPVELGPGLTKLKERIIHEVREKELGES